MLADGETGWLYLAPTKQLLAEIQKVIWETEDLVGFSKMNLLTIDGLVELVLKRAGFSYSYLEEKEALAVLNETLKKIAGEGKLNFYSRAVGRFNYLRDLLQALGELKRYLISPGQLKEAVKELGFTGKEKELALIYEAYQDALEEMGYFQQEDLYLKAIELLEARGRELLSGYTSLFMSNYFEFTPIKDGFLAKVIALLPRVEIHLAYDRRNPEAYRLTARTLKRFEDLGLEVKYIETEKEEGHLGGEMVRNLFLGRREVMENKGKFHFAFFKTREEEVRGIAREIKRLIIEDKYEPAEICLVPRSGEDYLSIVIRIFNEYEIPLGFNQEVNLLFHPLIRDVLKLYQLKIEGIKRDNLLGLALSPYLGGALGLNGQGLEKIASTRLIVDEKDWLELAREEGDGLAGIEEIIKLVNSLPEEGKCSDYSRRMMGFINRLPLEEQIVRLNPVGQEKEGLKALKLDLTALKKMREVLAGFDHPAYQLLTGLRITGFLELLSTSLGTVVITRTEGEKGGVQLFDPSALRGQEFRIVFLPGLEEGVFPRYRSENWIISEQTRIKLAGLGLKLPRREDWDLGEEFFLALAVSAARERIYLSYASGQSEEGRLQSWFVEEIRGLFFPDQSLSSFGRTDLSSAASLRELRGWLSLLFSQGGKEGLRKLESNLPNNLLSRIEAEMLRWEVAGKGFTQYNGNLEQAKIKERLEKLFGNNRVYSAGQFSEYASCPFAFFLKRVLGLKLPEEITAKLEGLAKGNIYHQVLARFLEGYKGRRLDSSQKEEYLKELKKIIEEILTKEEFVFLNRNPRWPVLKRLLERDLERWLISELRLSDEGSAFSPLYLEWSFGFPLEGKEDEKSTEKTLDLEKEGQFLRLGGRIDRIDYSEEGFYQALDYKTSTIPENNDLLNFLDFQIPIYLLAIQELLCQEGEKVLGGGYCSLKNGKRDGGLWQLKYKDKIVHRSSGKIKGNLDENEWEVYFAQVKERLFAYLDQIKAGRFYLNPQKCTSYCEFKTVCRFDPLQIAERGGEINEQP